MPVTSALVLDFVRALLITEGVVAMDIDRLPNGNLIVVGDGTSTTSTIFVLDPLGAQIDRLAGVPGISAKVAPLTDGRIAVVTLGTGPNQGRISYQLLNPALDSIGQPVEVGTGVPAGEFDARGVPGGGLAVVYAFNGQSQGIGYHIRRPIVGGSLTAGTFSGQGAVLSDPSVDALPNGSVVMAWAATSGAPAVPAVQMAIQPAVGVVGDPVAVDAPAVLSKEPAVAASGSGFVIAYTVQRFPFTMEDAFYKVFDAAGTAVFNDFLTNRNFPATGTDDGVNDGRPDIARAPDGNLAVTYLIDRDGNRRQEVSVLKSNGFAAARELSLPLFGSPSNPIVSFFGTGQIAAMNFDQGNLGTYAEQLSGFRDTAGDQTATVADTLTGDDFVDLINGELGNDVISGGANADDLIGGGDADKIFGGPGNDKLTGDVGGSVDRPGPDELHGEDGNDTLDGNDGNDILLGGPGADKVRGGTGTDTASYRTSKSGVKASLVAPPTNTGDAAGDSYVSIENFTGTNSDDTLVGNGVRNILEGLSGKDTLIGNGEHDVLFGGSGDDFLDGGPGPDEIYGWTGIDTARFTGLSTAYTRIANNVTGVMTVTGPDGADVLKGINRLQFDDRTIPVVVPGITFNGGTGPDSHAGTEGTDTLNGGGGGDTLAGGEGNDVIRGDAGSDILKGEAGNDQLFGGSETDTLEGGDGDDLLDGGLAGDVMRGGRGDDTYAVSTTADQVIELPDQGKDTVRSFLTAQSLPPNVENVVLAAVGGITATGNELSNILVGNANSNVLRGLANDDIMEGLAGSDTLDGGTTGADTARYASSPAGVTVNLATSSVSGGHAAGDTLISIEHLIGSAFPDTLTGDGNNNNLFGLAGTDVLAGGEGLDDLEGGPGGDTLNGGGGGDRATYAGSLQGVTVNLATGTASGGDAAGDSFISVEGLIGSTLNDTLTAAASFGEIFASRGDDTVTIQGGSSMQANGEAGRDTLRTSAPDFVLNGDGAFNREVDTFVLLAPVSGQIADLQTDIDEIRFTFDANPATPGVIDPFVYRGALAFTAPGQIRFTPGALAGNTDTDSAPEFIITIPGVNTAPPASVFTP